MPKAQINDLYSGHNFLRSDFRPSDLPPLEPVSDDEDDDEDELDLIPDVSAHSGRQASVASQSSNYAGLDDITELIVNYNERKHNDEDVAESIADHSDDAGMVDEYFDEEIALPPPATQDSTDSEASNRKRKTRSLSDVSLPSEPKRSRLASTSSASQFEFRLPAESDSLVADADDTCNPFIIASSLAHEKNFDARELSTGVRWELARLVSCDKKTPNDFSKIRIDRLDLLKGKNATAAPKVARAMLHENAPRAEQTNLFAKEWSAKTPWNELDKEEATRAKDPWGGLGCDEADPENYHGKVHFRGRLCNVGAKDAPPKYQIALLPAELGPSCFFTQSLGSSRFFSVKLSKDILNNPRNGLQELFLRPFVILGRVFRTFYAKDQNAFLIETNEVMKDGRVVPNPLPPAVGGPCSLSQFLEWYNPLALNSEQVITKWASRFALGLSNSVPGLRLAPEDIFEIPDIVSSTGAVMTDGCGLINGAALRMLMRRFGWHDFPIAVQVRVMGAKGLLLYKEDDNSEKPRIWLRPSQIKIRYETLDRPQVTIQVLRKSYVTSPARLSTEVIINLAEGGVPHPVLTQLFRDGLENHISGLMQWDDLQELWTTVARSGGVMSARLARESPGEARVRGYSDRSAEGHDLEDDDLFEEVEGDELKSTAWWADRISGCPSSLWEIVLGLLDSGFTPQGLPMLRDRLRKIVKHSLESFIAKAKIPVPMSCSAWAVPDPTGLLRPGEVQLVCSSPILKGPDGLETNHLSGGVYITRNPCKLPTDGQLVNAVVLPELRHLTDVLVFPVQGDRSVQDILAGGDFDGDRDTMFYGYEIISSFQPADLKFSHEPHNVADAFSKVNEKVPVFKERISPLREDAKLKEIQRYLLGAIRNTSIIGTYSTFHDNATYHFGYDHKNTIYLVYVFNSVLDAIKTGRRLEDSALKRDRDLYGRSNPGWKGKGHALTTRPRYLKKFIMDSIHNTGTELEQEKKIQMDAFFDQAGYSIVDPDLISPWLEKEKMAKDFQEMTGQVFPLWQSQRAEIMSHVHGMSKKHKDALAQSQQGASSSSSDDEGAKFTDLPIEKRQDILRRLSKEFASGPSAAEVYMPQEEIAKLRASYAYYYDSYYTNKDGTRRERWSRFPWTVAMGELCAIKARAVGPSKALVMDFYERMSIKTVSSKRSL